MKTRMLVAILILVIAVLLLGDCTTPNCTWGSAEDHYIKCIMDGQEYMLNHAHGGFAGHEGYSDDPPMVLSPDGSTLAFRGDGPYDGKKCDLEIIIYGKLYPDTPEVYIGTYYKFEYSGPETPDGFHAIALMINEGGTYYNYLSTDGTITITTFGDVLGDVVGAFNFTFESDNSAPAPSFDSSITATGEFRLLRVSDEYFYDW